MLDLLLQLRRIRQTMHFAVDDDTRVALGCEAFKQVDEFALARTHDGCEDLEFGALRHLHDLIDNLLWSL